MINNLKITMLTHRDKDAAFKVFQTTIPDAFEKEGLSFMTEDIKMEIMNKRHMIDAALEKVDSDTFFLVAKLDQSVIGAISFGPCGTDIKKCTDNQLQNIGELGSLYVLPDYQGQGIGSQLIKAMVENLHKLGIEQFCLDSGYKRAQKRWLRKFGDPYLEVEDYWGPGANHMIWLCNVSSFLNSEN